MTICIDVFKNLSIQNNNGITNIGPCCVATHKNVDVIEFFKDDVLTGIRKEWSEGNFPPACNNCKREEDAGNSSRRLGSNMWYADNNLYNTELELIRLDFWVGDLCNLACCICGPSSSSVWKQELKLPIQNKKTVVNKNWNFLDLNKIRFIHFNGGEPLLSKEHIRLLESIPDKSLVHINYNTNGTVLPDEYLIELWSKFKLVQIDISIDDVESRFEYQRYPGKWSSVTSNLKWLVDNCPVNTMFAVNTTVSILNNGNLNNLDAWLLENFKTNRLGDPVEYRKQFANGLLSLDGIPENKDKIVDFLNGCDLRRGTSWKTTFPELEQLI